MLRSEDVECVLMYCSSTGLKNTVGRLGDASIVQLRENGTNNGNFEPEIRAMEAVVQKLNYLRCEIEAGGAGAVGNTSATEQQADNRFTLSRFTAPPTLDSKGFSGYACTDSSTEDAGKNTSGSADGMSAPMIEVETEIQKYYQRLTCLKSRLKSHLKYEETLEQNIRMVEVAKSFVGSMKSGQDHAVINFDFVTAISGREGKFMIKKMVRHKLRRNVYIKTVDYSHCAIFIIYVLGAECMEYVKDMVEGLGGRVFDCLGVLRESRLGELREEHRKLRRLNKSIKMQIDAFLAAVSRNFHHWEYHTNREKKSLLMMSKLVQAKSTDCYCGEGWVLRRDLEKLNGLKSFDTSQGRFIFQVTKPGVLLSEPAANENGQIDNSEIQRPTHFRNTNFTRPFQNLTNVFGIPKYKEINPAIFMTFTFPFLFGAMFGDVLHGLILLTTACYLILKFDSLSGRCGAFQIILDGKYVVMACALAAIWFGLLYGDFGSLPISLFASSYEAGHKTSRTYPFGIDPIWHHAANRMVFVNSLKMKLSLIIGFAHMGLGSLISIANSLFFKDRITLICVAVPQCLAFFLFLGYLVFLCFYKWLVTITHPSLVNTLISMYTDPFNMKNQMYPGQLYVQLFIFSLILICIPWMFLGKPIYLMSKKKVPESGMLDLWITSGIHVVEFCLGLISNTSSYLRLWAVSLAHVQLTSVLHEFTLGNTSWMVKVLTFPIYLSGTFMLLIGLEGLSSCLHALRLNWIEFFSKFYSGGGQVFEPFNFDTPRDEDY